MSEKKKVDDLTKDAIDMEIKNVKTMEAEIKSYERTLIALIPAEYQPAAQHIATMMLNEEDALEGKYNWLKSQGYGIQDIYPERFKKD